MTHRLRQVARRRGVQAAAGTFAVCGVLGIVGAADAAKQAQTKVIQIGDDDGSFTPTLVEINTGDSVTWDFTKAVQAHNAAEDEREPQPTADPSWKGYATPFNFQQVKTTRTFNYPGDYKFVCQAHSNMTGTVKVTGDPVEPTPTATPTATATATATATPTATPIPTAVPDDHTTTPPPGAVTASDASAPALTRLRSSGKRGVAKLTFKLSETATITLQVKKGKKVLRTVRLQAAAGTRTVKVRSAKLKAGRYTIALTARDAMGNTSKVRSTGLRIKRK